MKATCSHPVPLPSHARRCLLRWFGGFMLLLGTVCPVWSQTASSWSVRMAADEDMLWVARTTGERSLVLRRPVNAAFQLFDPLNGAIVEMVAGTNTLYALVGEGAFYATSHSGWARRLDLPGRALPVDWAADGAGVVALIRSPVAGQLPRLVAGTRPATSQPFDPLDAPLSIVRYDAQGWIAVAACPADVTADGPFPPRVALFGGVLFLGHAGRNQQVDLLRWETDAEQWQAAGSTPPIANLQSFWLVTVNRVPMVIVAQRTEHGEEISGFRLLGRAADEHAQWRSAALHFSDLAQDVGACRCLAADGFNQHLVLLVADQAGRVFLRFARLDSTPTEQTVSVAELFADRRLHGQPLRWVQASTLLLLMAVLLSLFVFRRGALVTPAELPAELGIALTFQRLLATVVDLGPFVLVSAALMNVDWQRGLQELFGWAAGGEAVAGRFPDARMLSWWAVSSAAHTLYMLIMELLAGRTLGKIIAGTRVASLAGTRAGAGQIIVRNLLRLIELLPPLWILAFLVVLSRNRQRLGDVFARTIVVRSLPMNKPPEEG